MDEFWVVTFEGNIESHWFASSEVVTAYIDSKPMEPGKVRNSIEANSKWKMEPIHLFTSLKQKEIYDRQALIKSGMSKLTSEEKIALGLTDISSS